MESIRFAHVATCWVYLAALVLQFGFAGYGVMGGDIELRMLFSGTFLHAFIPLALMVTAWFGGLGWRQVLLGFGLFALLTVQILLIGVGGDMDGNAVQGFHPALAIVSAGYVFFWVLGPALDAATAAHGPETTRTGAEAGPSMPSS